MNSPQRHNHIALPLPTNEAEANQPLGTPLTVIERRDLVRLETEVRRDLKAFLRVGRALLEIKRRRLYRERYGSFEAYCYGVWGWKKSQAYRMLDAAEICAQLSPLGDTLLPTSERQVRSLRGCPSETVTKAWRLAVATANGKPVTGKMVGKAVSQVHSAPTPAREKETWQIYIEPLLKQAVTTLKQGDRDGFEVVIQRISCLLLVGKRPIPATESPDGMQL